jgi:pyridinium-3,5-bisthiocarboxylic acid mononucleotide nickel chelatase
VTSPGGRAGDQLRCLWVDASCGAAGDMILAALLDAGADRRAVETALAAISAAAGETIALELSDVRRHGLRARLAEITAEASTVHRALADVLVLLARAELPGPVRQLSERVFELLAAAEARVHGVPVTEIQFHEVGALDALADVVGTATALHSLGLLDEAATITVSSVGLGTGMVAAAHGSVPVPVPAVVELLTGAGGIVSAGPGEGELCTPTGAALLAAVAMGWGPLPAMVVRATGCGAGRRDPSGHPNVVRVIAGDRASVSRPWRVATLRLVESTLDDLDPRLWPGALEALRFAGALDAWLTPATMRGGRPAQVVSALTEPDAVDSVVRELFRTTTTLGARVTEVDRYSLPRDSVVVEVAGQPVSVKRGFLDGEPVTVQPELADARAAALSAGLSVAEVIDFARERARKVSLPLAEPAEREVPAPSGQTSPRPP